MGVLIDTSELPPSQRFARWREWWAEPRVEGVGPHEILPAGTLPFNGIAAMYDLGVVRVLHVRSGASITRYRPRRSESLEPATAMLVQHHGVGTYVSRDRVAQASAGAIMVSANAVEPWVHRNDTPFEFTAVSVNSRELGSRGPSRSAGESAISGDHPLARAVSPFLRTVAAGLVSGSIRAGDSDLGDCVLGAIRCVLHEVVGDLESRQPPLLSEIQAHIEANLGDPDLTPQSIADRHFISVRLLHNLFERERLTVARWIHHRRLERCRTDLADPDHVGDPVQAIAARWGLVNPSYFSRSFRLAYDCTPREYRRAQTSSPRQAASSVA